MKKRKIAKAALAVLSMLTIGAAGAAFAACDGDDDKHVHNYDKWILVTDPTLDAAGKAERYCKDNDGGKEETDVPKLTDTSVWTENLSVKVDPTCSATGKREFTSTDYGTVTVTLPVDSNVHSYGKWTLTKEPTKTETGIAVRVCGANGDHTDTKNDVPVLTDKSVWTLDEEKSEDATHVKAGKEVYTSIYGEVEVEIPANAAAHTWDKWEFVGDAPTLEAGGKIKRVCKEDNSHFEEKDVPALSNKDFWAETVTTHASHQNTGVADFKNAEYKIEVKNVTIPKVAHTFGAWTITTAPTLDNKGVATRVCSETEGDCAEDATATETKELPELGDAFWTKSHTNANYNSGSVDTYTNAEYGLEVKIVADDKKVAPYDDTEYYCFDLEIQKNTNKIVKTSRNNLYGEPILKLDGNNGKGTMYPVIADKVTVNSKNPDELTGELDFIIGETAYPAYYDAETKIIAVIFSEKQVFFFTPYSKVSKATKDDEEIEINIAQDNLNACTLTVANEYKLAINYEYETGKNIGIYVNDGVVTFNTVFKNQNGAIQDLTNYGLDQDGNIGGEEYVFYVEDGEGAKIENFGLKVDFEQEKISWTVADGFEGVYQVSGVVNGVDVCGFVNGAGILFYGADKDNLVYDHPAFYEVINKNSIGAILEIQVGAGEWQNIYYEFTMPTEAGGKVTADAPKVTVTLNANGAGTVDPLEGISKNVPVKLPVLEDEAKQFMGWFTDADCKNPVVLDKDGNYKPVADAELYAKWVNKRTLTLKIDANDAGTTIYFGEGEKLGKYLPDLDIDEANWRSFEGWFVDIDGKQKVDADTVLPALDDLVIYGEWKALPIYYGEYKGAMGNTSTSNEAVVSIDKRGNVTGKTVYSSTEKTFTAKVQSYDADTQVLVWQMEYNGETKNVSVLFYASADHATRIFVMHGEYNNNVDIMSSLYVLVAGKNVEIANDANISINYNKLDEHKGSGSRTRIFKYSVDGNEKLMLIFGDKIYDGVTLENHEGEEVAHAAVLDGKTIVVKQNEKVIAALGTTDAKLSGTYNVEALDAFFGKHTFETAEYVLDGMGNMTDGAKTYEYEVTDANKISAFELNEEKARVAHFTVTFTDGNITSFAEAKAKLTIGDATPIDIFTKVPYALADPENVPADKVFAGWHLAEDCSDAVITSVTIEGDTVIYADLREAIEVTFNANGGKFEDDNETKKVNAAKGMPLTMDEVPVHESGATFIGWFVDENTEWKSGETNVEAVVTLTAKWSLAPYIKNYKGVYISTINSNASDSMVSSLNNKNVLLEVKGDNADKNTATLLPFKDCTSSETGYGSNKTIYTYKVSIEYTKESHEIKFTTIRTATKNSTSTEVSYENYGIVDDATGIVIINYEQGKKDFSGGVGILFPSDFSYEVSWYQNCTWKSTDGAVNLYYDYKNENNETSSIYVHGSSVYFSAIAKDKEGNRILSKDLKAKTNNYIAIYASETATDPLFVGGNNGTTIVPFDGYEKTYSGDTYGSVVIDGVGGVTLNSEDNEKVKTGKYTVVSDNVLATTIDNVYYEITVDKTAETCVVTAPKASISFTFEHATVEFDGAAVTSGTSVQHGINVKFTLPTPVAESGYQFVGWYTEAEFTNAVTECTLANGDEVELFAKIETIPAWVSKDTAETLVFNDDKTTISGTTTALNMKYWAKLEIETDGIYKFSSSSPVKAADCTEKNLNYARYSVITEDGTVVAKGVSFDSNEMIALKTGSYFVEVHLGGQVTGTTYNYKGFGSFEINIAKVVVSDYTVGTPVVAVGDISKVFYKVTLETGKTYTIKLSEHNGKYSAVYIYNDLGLMPSTTGYVKRFTIPATTESNENDFTIDSGTYYIAINYDLTFEITEVVETPVDPSANPFAGKTYTKSTYDYEYNEITLTLNFDNGDAMSGTFKIDVESGWGSSTFTFVSGTLSGDTLTLTNSSGSTVVLTVSEENSKLKILSSSTYSDIQDYSNETLTEQS